MKLIPIWTLYRSKRQASDFKPVRNLLVNSFIRYENNFSIVNACVEDKLFLITSNKSAVKSNYEFMLI